MGAFCTKTICNVEKGDDNYNKLLNRNINMEKKKPEFESLPSRDVPDNDEQEVPMTPESPDEPKPAYTHSTPNSSGNYTTMTAISQQSRSVSTNQSTPPSMLDNNGNYTTDMIGTPTSKHSQVPTPSIQEIQAAMANMSVMFNPQDQDESDFNGIDTTKIKKFSKKDATPTLPTMADNVSNLHLKLANPFASPVVSDNPPSTFPAMPSIPSHQSIPSGQEINAGMPISSTKITEDISTISETMLGASSPIINQQSRTLSPQSHNNNKNINVNIPYTTNNRANSTNSIAQETTDIAEAAPALVAAAPITPTLANIFGGQGNSTIVIHGSDDEQPAGKLTLSMEGSSDQRDDTNVVFSPPNISDDKVEEEEEEDDINKVDDMNNSLQNNQKGADDKNVPKSETIPSIPSIPNMEIPADDNNDRQSNDVDTNDNIDTNITENDTAEIKEETITTKLSEESRDNDNATSTNNENTEQTENDRDNDNDNDNDNNDTPNNNTKADGDIEKEIANVDQQETIQVQEDRKDVDESEPKHYHVNIIEPQPTVPTVSAASSMNTRLSATNSNQSEENESEQEKRIDGNQQMTDPWKSDYETSDIESCDSFDKGEDDGTDGKKRRQSKTEDLSHLEAQHHLALNYEDTTLNDESTDDEESPAPGDHSKLYREHSRWKWQNKDISKHQKAMTQQLEKLQAEQEVAEMHNMMQYYRQQSEQLQ